MPSTCSTPNGTCSGEVSPALWSMTWSMGMASSVERGGADHTGAAAPAPDPPELASYEFDLGFTGVVRRDQTANWRYRIWKQSWPRVTAPAPELDPTST